MYRERELKLELEGREAFERLIAAASVGASEGTAVHEDHYFDSSDLRLLRGGAVLRIRRSSRTVLTFKQGSESEGERGYFDAIEVEDAIADEVLDRVIERPALLLEGGWNAAREALRRFGPSIELRRLGVIRTERARRAGEHVLEIDRVIFPDGSERYELEIETEDPASARRWIDARLAEIGARARPQRKIKLELLVEWLDAHGRGEG
ncbi:MAG: CYTH domain-containing protein [Planctomycetes bacterium]|nr:CYTH domain-containing protein [Planctomycetota bacterium]